MAAAPEPTSRRAAILAAASSVSFLAPTAALAVTPEEERNTQLFAYGFGALVLVSPIIGIKTVTTLMDNIVEEDDERFRGSRDPPVRGGRGGRKPPAPKRRR